LSYKRLQFLFFVFCFLWFFLLDYIIKAGPLSTLAVYSNYFLYVLLSLQLLFLYSKRSSFFGGKKLYRAFKSTSLVLLSYLFYAFLQLLINPELSDLAYFRQNYSVVLPSFALAFLLGLQGRIAGLNKDRIIKALFMVMGLVIVYSETLGSSIDGSGIGGDVRSGGVFDQANNYGYFLALFSLICVLDLIGFFRIFKIKPISVLVYFISIGLIVKTGSYGSLIVALSLGLYLSFNFLKGLNTWRTLSFLAFVAILPVVLVIYSQTIESNRSRALGNLLVGGSQNDISDESTFALRFLLINEGINSFLDDPFFGKGLTGRRVSVNGRRVPVHNVFIVELLKGGIIGLLMILLLYFNIWRVLRRLLDKEARRVGTALIIYMFLIDNTLTYPSFLSMNSGVIALALIFILVYQEHQFKFAKPILRGAQYHAK